VKDYYDLTSPECVLFEVEAKGDIVQDYVKNKSCTNKIKIVRIVPKEEYHKIFKKKIRFHKNGIIKYKEYLGCSYKYDETGKMIWKKYDSGNIYELKNGVWIWTMKTEGR
jgi:co-chaperonin GroES (HSP10)